MLRDVGLFHGANLWPFDQNVDFPLGLANTMAQGACSGLCFVFIKEHKNGQIANFRTNVMKASNIGLVENVKAHGTKFEARALKKFFDDTGLRQGVTNAIRTNVTAAAVGNAIGFTAGGYQILAFTNGNGTHTTALARESNGAVVYFDANYGCARFPNRTDFKNWFTHVYWDEPGGPNGNPPCTNFLMITIV